MKYQHPWTVAFGVDPPQEYASVQQVYEYLDRKFKDHRQACIHVDGPRGRLDGFVPREIWWSVAETVEDFEAYYGLVARGDD